MTITQTDRARALTGTLGVKAPVEVVAVVNIVLIGTQTIDAIILAAEDRVLLTAQTAGKDNGIWIVQDAAWIRAPDFDGDKDILRGTAVIVAQGTAFAGSMWRITTANPIKIGTTSIAFAQLTELVASAFMLTLLDDANAAAARTTLGLLSMSTQANTAVNIDGGTIDGITDLNIVDGGTGASTAETAFTALKQAASNSVAGVLATATEAQQETATSTAFAVTPGRQHYHPSAAKAFILAPSGFASIPISYNVTSLTDSGTGRAIINLTTGFTSTNYAVVMGIGDQAGKENTPLKYWYARTSGSAINISAQEVEANVNQDSEISVVMYGTQ